ncbi:MAG: DUF6483 family protein [Verrucomicrobiota bacterium]|jgi:hypothetical protein
MIRRDYILNAIEEFAGVLARILGFTKEEDWRNASLTATEAFQRLTGVEAAQALRMTDTELFARLIQDGPTQLAENKAFMAATLLKAIGDVMAGQGRTEESRQYFLKGLHLLLDTLDRSAVAERPEFVPAVEAFLAGLSDSPLPTQTNALLMRHYERVGEFGKAEDALFAIAAAEPPGAELLEFGAAFYQRLLSRSDAALAAGNLSRAEALAGLVDFRAKVKVRND